jgi:hypothetical protein
MDLDQLAHLHDVRVNPSFIISSSQLHPSRTTKKPDSNGIITLGEKVVLHQKDKGQQAEGG